MNSKTTSLKDDESKVEVLPGQPLLDLVNVCRDFDKVKVIKNVNLIVKRMSFHTGRTIWIR